MNARKCLAQLGAGGVTGDDHVAIGALNECLHAHAAHLGNRLGKEARFDRVVIDDLIPIEHVRAVKRDRPGKKPCAKQVLDAKDAAPDVSRLDEAADGVGHARGRDVGRSRDGIAVREGSVDVEERDHGIGHRFPPVG